VLRVQSDGNPASRSLDDLAVGDATLRLLSWALRHCLVRGCECRALRCPPAFDCPYDSLWFPCKPLIYTMVHYFTLTHKNKGYRDKMDLLRYNGAIELLTSSVSFCRGDLLGNSDSYSGGGIIPHH